MKAIVFHGVGDIRLEEVSDPRIQDPTDVIVRLTASAICGTDVHFVRGTVPGMVPGTILGHEGIGIVEEVGPDVRNFAPGDRVVKLVDWTRSGTLDPSRIVTQRQPLTSALEAYKTFAQHRPGWVKVELVPSKP